MTNTFDLELEVLSSMVDPAKIRTIYEAGVRAEHFTDPIKASAVQWSLDYFENSGFKQAPTANSIKHEFPMLEIIQPEESVKWLCTEIKTRYLANNIQKLLLDVSEYVHDSPFDALATIQAKAWTFASSTEIRSNKSDMVSSIPERKLRIEERKQAAENDEIIGARLGFNEIDKFTGGLRPGELATVAGFAKAGKTWVGVKAAAAAMQAKAKVMFITLELSIEEIEDRLDAVLSGVSYARQQAGALSRKEVHDLNELYDNLAEHGEILIEQPAIGNRSAKYIVQKAKEFDADLLIIDQMSHMEDSSGKPVDELRAYRTIVSDLKREISRRDEKQLPTILLAQMNRESQGRRHGRGDLSTLAGTAELERTSDIVFGISKSRQEAINAVATLEILGSRRTDLSAWIIRAQLKDHTEFSVLREREEHDE